MMESKEALLVEI